jgi:hypothetical protein
MININNTFNNRPELPKLLPKQGSPLGGFGLDLGAGPIDNERDPSDVRLDGGPHDFWPDPTDGGLDLNEWPGSDLSQYLDPGQKPTDAFVIDFDNNGKYEKGKDGALTFDMNGDGKYDANDVNQTSEMMRAAGGEVDLNGDGMVDQLERAKAKEYKQKFQDMDHDGDGKLSQAELNSSGGRIWVDENKDGRIGGWETSAPDSVTAGESTWNIAGADFNLGGRKYEVNSVNPADQSSSTSEVGTSWSIELPDQTEWLTGPPAPRSGGVPDTLYFPNSPTSGFPHFNLPSLPTAQPDGDDQRMR